MTPFNLVRVSILFHLLVLGGILISSVPESWVRPIAMIGVILSAIAANAFVVVYAVTQKWWKSAIGRHMMSFMAGLALILDLAGTALFYTDIQGRNELRVFVWTLVPFLFWWRLWILVRVKYKYYGGDGNPR